MFFTHGQPSPETDRWAQVNLHMTPALDHGLPVVDRRFLAGDEVSSDAVYSGVSLSLPRTPQWYSLTH
jgi:hypothetical protein